MFIHAATGCDTTSAPYGQGKAKAVKLMEKYEKLREIDKVFNDRDSFPHAVAMAGERFLFSLYGQSHESDITASIL